MIATTRALALACLLLAALACRRPDRQADPGLAAEITGAWVRPARDGAGVEGFDLRPGGRLALLNAPGMNGVAWNVSHGDLLASTTTERAPEPSTSRLGIAAHSENTLELVSESPDFFEGRYRRARAEHVAGVVTYLERSALPADARVEVELAHGTRVLARERFPARRAVPIPFELAYLPEGGSGRADLVLTARIRSGERELFATPEPVPLPAGAGASSVELLVRRVSEAE